MVTDKAGDQVRGPQGDPEMVPPDLKHIYPNCHISIKHALVCKQVVEPEGNKEEKMLNYEIGIALGFPIHELDEMMKKDNEVLEFRRNILNVTKAAVEERDKEGKKSQALYAFPPEIETSPLPKSLEDKLDKEDKFIISIWQLSPSCEKQKYTVI